MISVYLLLDYMEPHSEKQCVNKLEIYAINLLDFH